LFGGPKHTICRAAFRAAAHLKHYRLAVKCSQGFDRAAACPFARQTSAVTDNELAYAIVDAISIKFNWYEATTIDWYAVSGDDQPNGDSGSKSKDSDGGSKKGSDDSDGGSKKGSNDISGGSKESKDGSDASGGSKPSTGSKASNDSKDGDSKKSDKDSGASDDDDAASDKDSDDDSDGASDGDSEDTDDDGYGYGYGYADDQDSTTYIEVLLQHQMLLLSMF